MAEPFIGEVRIFPYTFPPFGWARCDGQILPINQNEALFSLVGTIYGGDGRSTLGIPNLRGRSPMHAGTGPGLTRRTLGQFTGMETVTLIEPQLPNHDHTAQASIQTTNNESAPTSSSYPAFMDRAGVGTISGYRTPDVYTTFMATQALATAGQSIGHENRQPCLGLYFCIALQGLYPSRN